MVETAPSFSEVDAYERFMGRWSRAVGGPFLRWLRPATNARWLDVGCGTGILSQMALNTCAPATIVGIDPTLAQVAHSAQHVGDGRARFEVADARALPFADETFDIVASALVLNFVPEPRRAMLEMRRVVRLRGVVSAYVWDFEPELSPSGPLRKALKAMGVDEPPLPGTQASTLPALTAMFEQAGLASIVATTIDVTVSFADFHDFWDSQTTSYSPTTKIVASLSPGERASLIETLRTLVSVQGDSTIQYSSRANAVKAAAAAPGYRTRHQRIE